MSEKPDLPPARLRTEEDALQWLWRKRFSDDGEHADCPRCEKQRKFRSPVVSTEDDQFGYWVRFIRERPHAEAA